MTGEGQLLIDERAGVLWVRINRPEKRNALSRQVLAELRAAFTTRAGNRTLRAAVLSGTGEQSFAAGGDLRDFSELRSAAAAEALFVHAHASLEAVRRFPVPVVAALNGLAIGGGAELALACDFRVAAAHATIGFVHARLNIGTGFGGGSDLARLLGAHRALALLLNAETLDAPTARTLGLVDAIATAGEPLTACVERFLAPWQERPAQVIRAAKSIALGERLGLVRSERERLEREAFIETWTHPDHWAAAATALRAKPGR